MSQEDYFKFVQQLAQDLNRDEIKLPSFPDVVMRIRSELDNPDSTSSDVAKILGNDAVLASRVLILANSAFHNPAGIRIEGLDAAVSRIGLQQVRTAEIAYAVEQLYASEDLAPLKSDLRATWSEGMCIAALSDALARHCTKLDPESAFIAGLLNRIGVLYIFTQYNNYPSLLEDAGARQDLIDEWAAPIGESIVGNWNFSEEIQATLNPDEVETTRRRVEPNLADVVTVAKLALQNDEVAFQDTPEARRLEIGPDRMPLMVQSYQQRLDAQVSSVS
jgi:HD-like signal output (HDOD) protein